MLTTPDRDQEYLFEASPGKKFHKTHLMEKKLGDEHPSYPGSINRRLTVYASLSINTRSYFKKRNKIK
jgi:hypothetical protein